MNEFHVFDLVDVKPWNDIADHYGIEQGSWVAMVAANPHQIASFDDYSNHFVRLQNSIYHWPVQALTLHVELSFPTIDDLI